MKLIQTKKAPAAVGPYAQAVVANGVVYCSGQIGLDPASGELQKGIEKQTNQVLSNLHAVLKASGGNKKTVVKTTIYLTDILDFAVVNAVYEAFFAGHKPARATVGVAKLPKGALVEIDAVAQVKAKRKLVSF